MFSFANGVHCSRVAYPTSRPKNEGGGVEHLQGKVAVITGGASGIGKAVAAKAAAEGMKLSLIHISEPTRPY